MYRYHGSISCILSRGAETYRKYSLVHVPFISCQERSHGKAAAYWELCRRWWWTRWGRVSATLCIIIYGPLYNIYVHDVIKWCHSVRTRCCSVVCEQTHLRINFIIEAKLCPVFGVVLYCIPPSNISPELRSCVWKLGGRGGGPQGDPHCTVYMVTVPGAHKLYSHVHVPMHSLSQLCWLYSHEHYNYIL